MIWGPLIAFMVAVGLVWRFCNPASRLHILDHPNERSLHTRPVPRSGGIAVLSGIVVGGIVVSVLYPTDGRLGALLLSGAPVAAISFLDDRYRVHPGARIVLHVLAAGILLAMGFAPESIGLAGLEWQLSSSLSVALLILFVVWMINLYNFMDGMDGFAGGMAVIGFSTMAILGGQAGDSLFAAAGLVVTATAGGFLLFNFPPARIFLGDTGSSTLGFLAAVFSLWASREGLFPLWISMLVFSPFIVDATVTLIRRLLHGDKVWRAHKTHYYQRLVQLGWGHRRTVLAEYLLMLACSLSALLAMHLSAAGQIGLILIWLLVYTLLIIAVGRLERYHWGNKAS
jgi:UDP-N-acetylmuramyl pentapeptide phosphotransferase/UDP-N-acetylglucosamine-1-phosphate transferase